MRGTVNDLIYSEVASSLHDAESIDRILGPVRAALDALGGVTATEEHIRRPIPHVIVVATGGTEQRVLEVVADRREWMPWEPVVLIAHPLHNSLPAAIEALARLRRDGVVGRIVQTVDSGEPATTVADLAAIHRLRRSRLGLVGEPSEWLVASVPDRDGLRDRWGIELVDIDVGETIRHHRDAHDVEVRPVAVRFTQHGEPTPETVAAAALHPTLTHTIERHRVDAVAVRCFDFITELSTSGCVALAELNDTGIVAGCEGDVASTVAMMIARQVLDQPAWIANPARIDPGTGELLLAHCTVAPSMVEDIELHTHFESGIGIGIRGTFAPGPITLLRLGGERLERHWFADGEVVAHGESDDLCRTQVTLRIPDRGLEHLLDDPLGNHLVMVRGHHGDRLERWWRLAFADH